MSEMEEGNTWASGIKKVYDPIKLKKEVESTNSPITVDEFIKFYKGKRERALNPPPVEGMLVITSLTRRMKTCHSWSQQWLRSVAQIVAAKYEYNDLKGKT